MAVLKVRGKLVNATTDGILADASQIKDGEKFQSQINAEMTAALNVVNKELTDKISTVETKLDNSNFIPEGGKKGQLLAWESSGKAKWEDVSNLLGEPEDFLAYGVEWDINVADPHLTRIGNMSFHRTLPIQSQLKGCVAQGDKVIYWLDEDDWNFKVTDDTYDIGSNPVASLVPWDVNTMTWDAATRTQTITTTGKDTRYGVGDLLKITAYEENKYWYAEVMTQTDTQLVLKYHPAESWSSAGGDIYTVPPDMITIIKIGKPARLDGYDGTVRVYCPSFYIKSKSIRTKRQVWLSTMKIDDTWTYQPEILIDAYRSTVLNAVPENMGYLSTLTVGCAISVVNTATYCRGGGNRANFDQYLNGVEASEGVEAVAKDIFRTDLGKPRTAMSRQTMRIEARNADSEMLSYDQYKNIFYWLYVVEYANFNCQEAYNAELTDDGYHQGGLGASITNMGNWDEYNGYYPLTPCGYGNKLGNGTGLVPLTIPEFTYGAENTVRAAQTMQMARWRGFDNPFGDIWTNLDGIIIDADADNHPNNMNYVYTCQDPAKFGDTLTDDYEKVGEEIHQDGYTKLFDLGDAAHIIPNVMGGSTTTHKCDYHQTGNKNTTLRTLVVGSRANHGAIAGLGYFRSRDGVSTSAADLGFQSVSRFVSFSQSE